MFWRHIRKTIYWHFKLWQARGQQVVFSESAGKAGELTFFYPRNEAMVKWFEERNIERAQPSLFAKPLRKDCYAVTRRYLYAHPMFSEDLAKIAEVRRISWTDF